MATVDANGTRTTDFPDQSQVPSWRQHRGPYLFLVTRPGKKAGLNTTEWLKGEVTGDTLDEEAQALLNDPRDTIIHICIWSIKEEQFVGHLNQGSV